MPAEQYHNFPLAPRDRTWDASEAVPRLRRWASKDGSGEKDQMDWQKYRKVFFWHEAGELEDFGQFKLPYCDILDGEPHVIHNAVANALARLPNTDIPEEDKDDVRRVAERQLVRFDEDEEEEEGQGADDGVVEGHIYTKEEMDRIASGRPSPSDLARINLLSRRPLSADEVFTFPVKMAGDAVIPFRHDQIHKSLLEVFRDEARSGVAFMLDHPWAGFGRPKAAIPYGRTYDAVLRKGDASIGESWALQGKVYLVRGKEMDGISTDAIISSVEDGTLFDVSVGFIARTWECSICGKSIFECEHWPGVEYNGKLCHVILKPPGSLMELSAVFDGAYPTAGVLGATGGEAETPLVSVSNVKAVREGATVFCALSRGVLLSFARKEDVKEDRDPGDGIRLRHDRVRKVLGADHDASTILRLAADGVRYREELIRETLEWGIRAQGNDFPEDAWRAILTEPGRALETIREFRSQFEQQARKSLSVGRATIPDGVVKKQIPDDAYRA